MRVGMREIIGLLVLFSGLCPEPASAQNIGAEGDGGVGTNAVPVGGETPGGSDCCAAPPAIPPERLALSPGNVDMRSGTYTYRNVDVAIGDAAGGLSFERQFDWVDPQNDGFARNLGEMFSHNWNLRIVESRIKTASSDNPGDYDFQMSVMVNEKGGTTFRSVNMGRYNVDATDLAFFEISNDAYSTLTMTGKGNLDAVYTYTSSNGTKVYFEPMGTNNCPILSGPSKRCAYVSSIDRPDGTRYTLEYAGPLKTVTSNRGYAILLEYDRPTSYLVTKACVINLALRTMPADKRCPSDARAAVYSYSGTFLETAVDASGVQYRIDKSDGVSFRDSANTTSVRLTGSPQDGITRQDFADGTHIDYEWDTYYPADGPGTRRVIAGGKFTDGSGHSATVRYGIYGYTIPQLPHDAGSLPVMRMPTPGPETVIDQLGRITRYDYCIARNADNSCALGPIASITASEGDIREFTYGNNRNIVKTVFKPKPDSGASNRQTTAVYPCNTAATCDRPSSVTDFNGNTTDYSYDGVHGGILTEAGPAGPNGIRPVKRSSWAQRHAWLKQEGGGFVRASTAVWLLTEERTCRTTATSGDACTGGSADEVVTTYDYGPDDGSVGNNLLLRGVAVSADGRTQRTCYGYDAAGNRVSETKPRAGLTACP